MGDEQTEGRSRRGVSSQKSNRLLALKKLKDVRSGDAKQRLEIKEEKNVYDVVEESEYSDIVRKRLEDDWIVDDDGIEAYVEDGREIFDEEVYVEKGKRKKQKPVEMKIDDDRPKTKTIKSFFNRQNLSVKEEKKNVNLDEDEFLKQLLEEVKPKAFVGNGSNQSVKPLKLLKRKTSSNFLESESQDRYPPLKKQAKVFDVNECKIELDADLDALLVGEDIKMEVGEEEAEKEEEPTAELNSEIEFGKNASSEKPSDANYIVSSCNHLVNDLDYVVENDDKYVKMYWFDAYDGWTSGSVYLFGKVYVKSAKKFVSCCAIVKSIEKRVFILPNADSNIESVRKEISNILTSQYKITKFRTRGVKKLYAFERKDVPLESEYLELLYPSTNNSLPTDLKGETFSCVFGTNQSCLERLLLDLKLKGPGWLKFKNPLFSNVPESWCKIEFSVDNYSKQIQFFDDQMIPPMTLLSLKLKTYLNSQTNQTEIIGVSFLCNSNYKIESGSASIYDDHFCIISKPSASSGIGFPINFTTAQVAKMKTKTKIHVMGSERELVNFFMARFGLIDPDIVVGHDIQNVELDLILSRLIHFKNGSWSKLGRFKRHEAPNKKKDRIPVTAGRLVCDVKLSSKELIRLNDYELTELVKQILGGKKRYVIEQKDLPKYYAKEQQLVNFINFIMIDHEFVLSILQELNILPLALQITKIAGNVMSRTLLGGRSERNEFLLLHAFHERNYIVPDKSYGKTYSSNDSFGHTDNDKEDDKTHAGRRKPAYTGGLVLEPKVGFYDQFILLMDFNSLYPSIIQEFNICFTTVSRAKAESNELTEDEVIPEEPNKDLPEGILPIEIRKLVESRREVKKLLCKDGLSSELKLRYDVKQKALKLTANSMYGCLGFKNSRFYAKPLAALITFKGREILMRTKTLVENMGLEVIYGDTDSIMINTNCVDFQKCTSIGDRIQSEINGLYKLLEIEIDGIFQRMLLLKKKKYACLTVKGNNPKELKYEREVKGLDIVRRDWSILAKEAGNEVLSYILSLEYSRSQIIEKIHECLRVLGEKIRNDEFPIEKYEISKQLTKNPVEYADKKSLTHVAVALACNQSGKMEKKFRNGDTVSYVICVKENDEEGFNNLPATRRGFHKKFVEEDTTLKIDSKYYLSQQVHPVVCRLCDPLEETNRHLIAEFLGIEDYVENKRKEDATELQALVANDKCRFDTCKSISFVCTNDECQQTIEIRHLFKSDSTKLEQQSLSLTKCPHCSEDFKESRSIIKLCNQLRSFIRTFVNDYYKGWLSCHDPVCCYRTRCFTGKMSKKGPLCPQCKDMTDVQLYLQLMFVNNIFDVDAFTKEMKSEEQEKLKPLIANYRFLYDELLKVAKQFKSSLEYRQIDLSHLFRNQRFECRSKRTV